MSNYKRFDTLYWIILIFILVMYLSLKWIVDKKFDFSVFIIFLITSSILGFKVYKWFQEED